MKNQIIATAKFEGAALGLYCDWWQSTDKTFGEQYAQTVGGAVRKIDTDIGEKVCASVGYNGGCSWNRRSEDDYHQAVNTHLQQVRDIANYAQRFNQPLNIALLCEQGAYIFLGNAANGVFIPNAEKWLTIEPLKDFSNITLGALKAQDGQNTAFTLPAIAEGNQTLTDIQSTLERKKSGAEQLTADIEDVKSAKNSELVQMQAEIEKLQEQLEEKKKVLLADLEEKKAAMDAMVDQLGKQIYLLENQIYAVRCYMGETVNFAHIKEGRNAPESEPIVLHQKLRFLDEELGRMTALYELEWDDRSMFEDFLTASPVAQDTFAPNERCVTMVRLTRNSKRFGRNVKYANMLQQYDCYHGTATAIIIRNGENLYIGWTDDEKVHVDEDMILTMKTTAVEPMTPTNEESEWAYKKRIQREKIETEQLVSAIFSRVFIFNVLQGIVDNSTILPLPEGVKISQTSEYVLFALADNWLEDNRFGSFTQMVNRCNEKTSVGDIILTTQQLFPFSETSYRNCHSDAYYNERGRGIRNRTRDCQTADCAVYPINLVEYDPAVQMIRYRYQSISGNWNEHVTEAKNKPQLQEPYEIMEEYEYAKKHMFVSVAKAYSDANAHSNFEVFPHEFINLTYLNTVWLEYVINNKKLGNWEVGGQQVDYAFAIRYLNYAMEVVRTREQEEKRLIDAVDSSVTSTDHDWSVKLSEWKLAQSVRKITPYQAKRFVKEIKTKGDSV